MKFANVSAYMSIFKAVWLLFKVLPEKNFQMKNETYLLF